MTLEQAPTNGLKRIIVTGGAGFIGSALCRHLLSYTDAEILVIDKLTYAASPASLPSTEQAGRLTLKTADICDAVAMQDILTAFAPDAVFHLAAETHVDRSIHGASAFLQTNIVGTYVLLQAALSHWERLSSSQADRFRFVHISTDEVFGSVVEGAFDEATPYDPSSPYSATKASSDHLVRAWHRTYGLPTLVSNCSNNYGPRQFPEKLIPLMILKAIAGEDLPVYGDGQNIRDWLFVDDHASALLKMAIGGAPGRTYTIGGNAERTNLQVVEAICARLDQLLPRVEQYAKQIRFVEDRPGHDFRYAVDSTQIRADLGWQPSVSFEDGLARTIDWYLGNEKWWRPLLAETYGGERLGLSPSKADLRGD